MKIKHIKEKHRIATLLDGRLLTYINFQYSICDAALSKIQSHNKYVYTNTFNPVTTLEEICFFDTEQLLNLHYSKTLLFISITNFKLH